MKGQDLSYIIIGTSSRLTKSIIKICPDKAFVVDRSIYSSWYQTQERDEIRKYLTNVASKNSTIFLTTAILDPRATIEDILKVNYNLPKNVIEASEDLDVKVVTFGTVHEGMFNTKNPYVGSKSKLSNYVSERLKSGGALMHIKMHTLFGKGYPNSFMFLGQILESMRNSKPFYMTNGDQLREYHHYKDVAKSTLQIIEHKKFGCYNISHSNPLPLKDIADFLFTQLDKKDLLKIGAIKSEADDNYNHRYPEENCTLIPTRQEQLNSILEYLEHCLRRRNN